MSEPRSINMEVWYQRVLADLHAAELTVARLQGQRDLIREMIADAQQPMTTTEGEDAPEEPT